MDYGYFVVRGSARTERASRVAWFIAESDADNWVRIEDPWGTFGYNVVAA